jgi:hypothetical protein
MSVTIASIREERMEGNHADRGAQCAPMAYTTTRS